MAKDTASGGFTLLELLIVVATISVLAAIAIPTLLRARISANEASAIGTLRTIGSAQSAFASNCGAGGYAQRLSDLAKPTAGSSQGFVGPDLAFDPSEKSGYRLTLEKEASADVTDVQAAGTSCNGAVMPTVSSYWAGAAPLGIGGLRTFALDRRGTIFQAPSGAVVPNPVPPGALPIQ
jgi:prepilin-type N-terminal cleavage/methylation domain-containing protein